MDSIEEILITIRKFNKERDWEKFHSGVNLAKSISIEANELLELYQWSDKEKSLDRVKEELGDVLIYCFMMADVYGLDPKTLILEKLASSAKKYPVEKCKGKMKKYNEL